MDDVTMGYYIGLGVAAILVALLMADTWIHHARPFGPLPWVAVWLLAGVFLAPSKRQR